MYITSDYGMQSSLFAKKFAKTKADAEFIFEFEVNRKLMDLDAFVLYWDINLFLKKEMKWVLCGDFFTTENSHYLMTISKKKQIDHLLVTPSAVFVFESNDYSSKYLYTRANGRLYKSGGEDLPDPTVQANIYGTVVRQILRYYNVDLPVISKGLFKKPITIHNDSSGDTFVVFNDLLDFVNQQADMHPSKPMEAIKLCKSLYFDRCHPIAYDGNTLKW